MQFDNSFDAVFEPGEASVYFDNLSQKRFEPDATGYSPINAWWLAELCRLVYKQGPDEKQPPDKGPARKEALEAVGLKEVKFFNRKDTQCAIVESAEAGADRFAALVFRGTTNLKDWLTDFKAIPETWRGRGLVHVGFRDALEAVWDDVAAALKEIDTPLFCAGHSLGAALATLAAPFARPKALYTFGSPRVGDRDFAANMLGIPTYRVVNNLDVVTTVPPPTPFHHVGELHYITHSGAMLVEPSDATLAIDRLKRDHLLLFSGKLFGPNPDAPEVLADHAPVNYVTHLEKLFST
jgi:triacylglycerol lipase